jgi:hypothetical protein
LRPWATECFVDLHGKVDAFLQTSSLSRISVWGIVSILEVLFLSLRDPDFNRWEVDEGGGSYIQILGWRKMLTPPRVLAQGYMSDRAACAGALVVGGMFILIAMFGFRHVSGLPEFFPDVFDRP